MGEAGQQYATNATSLAILPITVQTKDKGLKMLANRKFNIKNNNQQIASLLQELFAITVENLAI